MAPRPWGNAVTTDYVPEEISDRQFFQQLALLGMITEQEALAAVQTGTLPAALDAFITELPADDQFGARMLLSGATVFKRSHPLTEQFGEMQGLGIEAITGLWRSASVL